jgi:hypothetical protein
VPAPKPTLKRAPFYNAFTHVGGPMYWIIEVSTFGTVHTLPNGVFSVPIHQWMSQSTVSLLRVKAPELAGPR